MKNINEMNFDELKSAKKEIERRAKFLNCKSISPLSPSDVSWCAVREAAANYVEAIVEKNSSSPDFMAEEQGDIVIAVMEALYGRNFYEWYHKIVN